MAEKSKISWCDNTQNFWWGCTMKKLDDGHIHPACINCYAKAMSERFKHAKWGDAGTRLKTGDKNWDQPLRWNARCGKDETRETVFVNSMSDFFEDWRGPMLDWKKNPIMESMVGLRSRAFRLMDEFQNLDWLLLSKRPENVRKMWPGRHFDGVQDLLRTFPSGYTEEQAEAVYRPNAWLGTSISDQATADKYVPLLLKNRDLVPVLFLSLEPLLGRVDLDLPRCESHDREYVGSSESVGEYCNECAADGFSGNMPHGYWLDEVEGQGIDWVIIGCESNGPRVGRLGDFEDEMEWLCGAMDVVRQCEEAGVPCFVKQIPLGGKVSHDPDEWPEALRVREKPRVDGALNG